MADIFQPVHLLSFLMQIIDPVHKSDTCVAASNVMFLIAAPIDCALQISDTCLSIESSLLNGAASVYQHRSLLHDPKHMLYPIDIWAAIRNKRFFSPD